jgi:hypothetical protein
MDDVWIRVGVIAAALAFVAAAAVLRRRTVNSPRMVRAPKLEPGIYFFASATCETCDRAREKLDRGIGADGYTEFVWEERPQMFDEIGVDAVPSVLVAFDRGGGRLYPGQPERALRAIRRR